MRSTTFELRIEIDREQDGRYLAEVMELPGVLADRIESRETLGLVSLRFDVADPPQPNAVPPEPQHQRVLDDRIAELDRHPDEESRWEEVLSRPDQPASAPPKDEQGQPSRAPSPLHRLLEGLEAMTPEHLQEVSDFVDFLAYREDRREDRDFYRLSESALAAVWDNPEDAVYDDYSFDRPQDSEASRTSVNIKDEARKMLDRLPELATWEALQYHIYVRQKIEAGLEAIAHGRVLSQEEVERHFAELRRKWSDPKAEPQQGAGGTEPCSSKLPKGASLQDVLSLAGTVDAASPRTCDRRSRKSSSASKARTNIDSPQRAADTLRAPRRGRVLFFGEKGDYRDLRNAGVLQGVQALCALSQLVTLGVAVYLTLLT